MKPSIRNKLDHIMEKARVLNVQLSDPKVIEHTQTFTGLSKELHALSAVHDAYAVYKALEAQSEDLRSMQDDPSMRDMVEDEMQSLKKQMAEQEKTLMQLLLPKDPDDDKNVYLELRAGTGGDEASLFAGSLFRMYQMYAQSKKWRFDIVHAANSDQGGYKEVVVHVQGRAVFACLKYESGTHRVQRVPETESQGRVHTSACTVAILPEAEAIDSVDVDASDIRVDTFRSSGAGGQHVNTTDSAVRLTHIPTGIVVECQDERSQHKNKAKAMNLLQAKILATQKQAQAVERSEQRRLQVGSGDRSERIRTYNFPQGRVSDHRINLTLYKLDSIMQGELDLLVAPLAQEDQADKMASMDDDA